MVKLPEVAYGWQGASGTCCVQRFGDALRLNPHVHLAFADGVAVTDGFNIHAATTVVPADRTGLESLCKYMLRPAICNERMQRLVSGQVLICLKKMRSDGTFAKLFEPADLIARVIALGTHSPHGCEVVRS